MTTDVMILDLGLSERFEASMDYARALVRSTQTGANPAVDLHYVHTGDPFAVSMALLADVSIVHVMGHGENDLDPQIVSDAGRAYRVRDHADFSAHIGIWPVASCLIMDACNTWQDGWFDVVAECLLEGQQLLYVGTTRSVTWAETTLFTGNFYAAALRSRLRGNTDRDWEKLQHACDVAADTYRSITGRRAPFKWGWIDGVAQPSPDSLW